MKTIINICFGVNFVSGGGMCGVGSGSDKGLCLKTENRLEY